MYKICAQFTEEYLKILMEFSKYLAHRNSGCPPSKEDQLTIFFSHLCDKLRVISKKLNRSILVNDNISINPNIIFRYNNPKTDRKNLFISFGGLIKIVNSEIVEQSLSVNILLKHTEECNAIPKSWQMYPVEKGYHILRKFHFDFDIKNDDLSKPKFHLQYGGSFKEKYLNLDETIHYNLFNPLDNPRFPQQPYDIIILLDFILREFSLAGNEITNERKWNNLIISCEKHWLKPYYENLLARLNENTRSTPLHRIK